MKASKVLQGKSLQTRASFSIKLLSPEQIRKIHTKIEKSPDSLAVSRLTQQRVLKLSDEEVENVTDCLCDLF
jgi:hypothetical protein